MILNTRKMVRAIFLGAAILSVWVAFGLNEASAAVSNLGLVGYWSMNEGTGSYAGDSSGNKNIGILTNGPTWVDGKRGKALNFDGVDDYVTTSVPSMTDYSYSAWFYTRSFTNGLANDGSGTHFVDRTTGTNALVSLKAVGGNFAHQFRDNAGAGLGAVSGGAIQLNTWQYVTWGRKNGSELFIYVNTVKSSTSDTLGVLTPPAPKFGGHATLCVVGTSSGCFNGLIDEVRVYNRALSAAEIQALYKSGAQKFTAPPTNLGLVGYWSMNEGTGSYAGDSSGNRNQGTLTNGPTWVDGKRGKALNFDGTDDNVQVKNTSAFALSSGNYTISLWVNYAITSAEIATYDRFLSWLDGATNIQVGLANCTTVGACFYLNNASTDQVASVATNIALRNGWQHIVVVKSASYSIYVNGVNAGGGTTDANVGRLTGNTATVFIGQRGDGVAAAHTKGILDDVRIYNRALSAAEIQALYKSGAQKFTAPPTNLGLVGYWSFNDATSTNTTFPTRASDFSGNGNTGTLTNGPTWVDGKRGKALNFDYVDDYVEAADKASLRVGVPSFTFSAWLNPGNISGCADESAGAGCIVFNKENSYEWGISNNGKIQWAIRNTSPGWAWANSGLTAPSGVWTHIVITYNGSNIITYKNGGASINSQAGSGNVDNTTYRNALRIGARNAPAAASAFFPGKLDDVRIYNRALSATEILKLYQSGAGRIGL